MLLQRGVVLIPMIIFFTILCSSNTLHATSITGTKERIKEIKFEDHINIEKLRRNKKVKVAFTSYYVRTTKATVRSQETERIAQPEVKQEEKTPKTEHKKVVAPKEKKESIKEESTEKKEAKKETKTKKTEQKTSSTSAKRVRISRGMDLTKRTGLSKEEFKKLVKHVSQDTSKFFYNNADYIYDMCQQYQINEIFFCGLISAESGWNIASNHRRTHNYISLMMNGKLIHYSSTHEGLRVAAQKLHNNYLTPGGKFYGGKTLAGVKKKFCPSGGWVNLVYGRMSQMMAAAKKI